MIHHILSAITDDLNSFLMRKNGAQEPVVELSALVNLDGSIAISGKNKVVCSLVNIRQDRTTYNMTLSKSEKKNPPVQLNLFILFSAYYQSDNYQEGLKALSNILGFFQGKQIFTPQNTSYLSGNIKKFTLELVDIDLNDIGNFWSALGGRHLPAVLYKCRLISITEDMILEDIPAIKGFNENPIN